jgi:hypothetical protein
MELSEAEREMIEMLRGGKHISLTIHQEGGEWQIRLEHHDTGLAGNGLGPTFDRAWDDIVLDHLR